MREYKFQSNKAIVLDNQVLFAESFSVMLEKYRLFEAVHVFGEVESFVEFLVQHSVETFYIFVDYYFKNTNGLMIISDIYRINKRCKVIFVTYATSWLVIYSLKSYHANAIISKSNGLDVLFECIAEVSQGNFYLCPVFNELKEQQSTVAPVAFTPREIEVLQYFAEGNTISQTAEKLCLSRHTVVSHRRNMMAKAKINSVGQLLKYAYQWRII